MAGSPAFKIVRPNKPPGNATHGPRVVCRGQSTTTTPIVAGAPLPFMMTDAELGRELRLSAMSIRRMHDAGKLPRPVVVGSRSLRWVRQTIAQWLGSGCPDGDSFERMQGGGLQ